MTPHRVEAPDGVTSGNRMSAQAVHAPEITE
jgi:hypothetical protein